ncbi:MAG: hypothetical protein HYV07_08810 [Deltaproteobacteria bacterium]|nr:hypothetical protein [Deltaproteobacteria bacterium]
MSVMAEPMFIDQPIPVSDSLPNGPVCSELDEPESRASARPDEPKPSAAIQLTREGVQGVVRPGSRPEATRVEAISPFVAHSAADLGELPASEESGRSLLVDLLREPEATVRRLLDPKELAETVLGALSLLAVTTSFFAAVVMSALPYGSPLRAAAVLPINVLLALAAALGPMYATGIIVAARVPMSRLVAVVLAASATGAAVLAALAPIPYALYRIDDQWVGPISMFSCCVLGSIAGGARLHVLLYHLAREVRARSGRELSTGELFRVGIVARMSMVVLAFTVALAGWVLDVFV